MAKLNVKVVGEVIEWNGEQYRKVDRYVREGDVVQANFEWFTDVDRGSYYEVISVNNGYFQFADNAGDVRTIGREKIEYFIPYEKVAKSTSVAEPTNVAEPAESSDLITYEGGTYRKVNRKAKADERVLITKIVDNAMRDMTVGNVYVVKKQGSNMNVPPYVNVIDDVGEEASASDTGYVVLEPVTAPASATYEQDGVTYRPTVAGEKPTHFIRKPDADHPCWISRGKIYKITRIDGDGDYCFVNEYGVRDGCSMLEKSTGLVQTKPRRLTVGNYAKVVVTDDRGFPVGQIRKITKVDSSDIPYQAELLDGSGQNWFEAHELALASAEEVDAALAEIKKPARVPIGTYVKITNGDDLPNGSIAKVTEDDNSGYPYLCELLDGSDFDWLTSDDFEVLSEADAKAEIVRQKWAAIGRGVGVIKTGDVVEVVSADGGRNPQGRIGVATEDGTESSTCVATIENPSGKSGWARVRLITPVEQRFDRPEADR